MDYSANRGGNFLSFPLPIFVGPLLPSKNTFPNHKYVEIRFLPTIQDSFFHVLSSSLREHMYRSGFCKSDTDVDNERIPITTDANQEGTSSDKCLEEGIMYFSHLTFLNYYTSFIEIEQRFHVNDYNSNHDKNVEGGQKNLGVSNHYKVNDQSLQEQNKSEYVWKTIFTKKLMPHPNYEQNSQSKFTIYAADFNSMFEDSGYPITSPNVNDISSSKDVPVSQHVDYNGKPVHLRIKLYQTSPLWNYYSIEKVKCYGKVYLKPTRKTRDFEVLSLSKRPLYKVEAKNINNEEESKLKSYHSIKSLHKIKYLQDNLQQKLEALND